MNTKIDLLSNVFGIKTPSDGFITFEDHRMVDASNFIDGRIRSTKVLIEQKSLGKDLRAGIRQSDNSLLNPFQQALPICMAKKCISIPNC